LTRLLFHSEFPGFLDSDHFFGPGRCLDFLHHVVPLFLKLSGIGGLNLWEDGFGLGGVNEEGFQKKSDFESGLPFL